MLLSHRQNSLCKTSMYDKDFFGFHPITYPNPDNVYESKMYFLWNPSMIKKNFQNSINPSIIRLKQETRIKLSPLTYFKFEIESGEDPDPQIKLSLETPLVAKIGLTLGQRNGYFMKNVYKKNKLKFTLNNKIYNEGNSKISLKGNYDDYVGLKYSFDKNTTYSMFSENKLNRLFGFQVKLEFDDKFDYRIAFVRSSKKIDYYSNSDDLAPLKFHDAQFSPEFGNMMAYHYNKPFGIENAIYCEKNRLYGDSYSRIGLHQKVYFNSYLGYSWGFQMRSTSSVDIMMGLFFKNIHIEIPILESLKNSDIIESTGYISGFILFNYLTSKLLMKFYNFTHDQKSIHNYSEEIEDLKLKKRNIDKILKSNRRITNPSNDEIRVFVMKNNHTRTFTEDQIWNQDFYNQKYENNENMIEITETYFFYMFILGYLPQEKRGLIGYLNPLYLSHEKLKIVILTKLNENIRKQIFDENKKI